MHSAQKKQIYVHFHVLKNNTEYKVMRFNIFSDFYRTVFRKAVLKMQQKA